MNEFLKLCRCIVKWDIRVVMGVCESIRLSASIYVCGCVCVGKVEPLELDTPRLWTLSLVSFLYCGHTTYVDNPSNVDTFTVPYRVNMLFKYKQVRLSAP